MARKRTNRVDIIQWSEIVDPTPFEIVAWKIVIVMGTGGSISINGVNKFTASNVVIPLGGAHDDFGCPINTLFSGQVATAVNSSVMVFVEYLDPEIGGIKPDDR